MLRQVVESSSVTTFTGDLRSGQTTSNYSYDETGRLTGNAQAGVSNKWNVYNKVTQTSNASGYQKYYYGPTGERIKKEEYNTSDVLQKTTWYVHDAGGQVLSIYEQVGSGDVVQKEVPIYGAGRIGEMLTGITRSDAYVLNDYIHSREVNKKEYELKDHLGNVRVVISDLKRSVAGCTSCLVSIGEAPFIADIRSYSNYYPFGMEEPGRCWSDASYRYGYNGKEKDNELKGEGNSYDYGMRLFDPRVGRWFAIDKLAVKYPSLSPYAFTANNPILQRELDGRDFTISSIRTEDGKVKITIEYSAVILNKTGNPIDAVTLQKELTRQVESNFSKDFKLYTNQQASELSQALDMSIANGAVISVEMKANIRIGSSPGDVNSGEHKINVLNDEQWLNEREPGASASSEFLGDDMYFKESHIGSSSKNTDITHETGHLLGLPHVGSRLAKSIGMEDFYPTKKNNYANMFNVMLSGTDQRKFEVEGINNEINTPQFVRIISNVAKNKDTQPTDQRTLEQGLNDEGK